MFKKCFTEFGPWAGPGRPQIRQDLPKNKAIEVMHTCMVLTMSMVGLILFGRTIQNHIMLGFTITLNGFKFNYRMIVAKKVFQTIWYNTHIIARDVLYTHGMSILRGV